MDEDLSWAIVGGLVVWLLFKKPCPCSGGGPAAPAGGSSGSSSPSSGGCNGGLPTCPG